MAKIQTRRSVSMSALTTVRLDRLVRERGAESHSAMVEKLIDAALGAVTEDDRAAEKKLIDAAYERAGAEVPAERPAPRPAPAPRPSKPVVVKPVEKAAAPPKEKKPPKAKPPIPQVSVPRATLPVPPARASQNPPPALSSADRSEALRKALERRSTGATMF